MNKKMLKIIGISFVATLVIGGVGFYFYRKRNQNKNIMPSEGEVKRDLPVAISDGDKSDLGYGQIYTDYGDGWHYQRRKNGGWIARKSSGGNWYDLTKNDNYSVSLKRLDDKYGKA